MENPVEALRYFKHLQAGGAFPIYAGERFQRGGGGQPIFHGSVYQRGDGAFLDFLKRLGKGALDIMTPVAGAAARTAAGTIAQGISEGRNFKDIARSTLSASAGSALRGIGDEAQRRLQGGRGRKRRRTKRRAAQKAKRTMRKHTHRRKTRKMRVKGGKRTTRKRTSRKRRRGYKKRKMNAHLNF